MKKLLSTLAVVTALGTGTANALGPIDIEVGGGIWNGKAPIGTFSDGTLAVNLQDSLGLAGNNANSYTRVVVEHVIPFVPNIRWEQSNMTFSGTKTFNATFFGQTYSADVNSGLNVSHQDVVLYWGVPLTGIMSSILPLVDFDMDFGFGGKIFNGLFTIKNPIDPTQDVSQVIKPEISGTALPIPYGYIRARVAAAGIGVDYDLKIIGFNGNAFSDSTIKLDYTFDLIPLIDLGVEVGYRNMSLNIETTAISTNLQFNGIVYGAFARF